MRRVVLAVACLATVAVTGCGGGSHGSPPLVGGQTTTTSISTTSTSSAALPGTGRPAIVIGDKNYTEQFLLGQLYQQALRGQGYDVTLNPDIAGVILPSLQSRRISLLPEYLSTWTAEAGDGSRRYSSLATAYAAGERLARVQGLRLLTPTPFADTAGVAVTPAYAAANRLRVLADLPRVGGTLTFGGDPQFQTEADGLSLLQTAYGFAPIAYTSFEVGAQYPALISGSVQAAQVKTTDGQLTAPNFQVLGDPDRLFGFGNVVPVVSEQTLAVEGPVFRETIERIDRLLTLAVMRQLNAAVDLQGQSPANVAQAFLASHGLLGLTG
jgi:osmoprotectant transport system substrate-binding protein